MWNPYLYHLLMPKIPSYNDKPPTIYQILQAIVNYGADEKTKTMDLAKIGRVKIFDFEDETYLSNSDQYNMCPDCGNYFGLETDGGNGFCINCAWNH